MSRFPLPSEDPLLSLEIANTSNIFHRPSKCSHVIAIFPLSLQSFIVQIFPYQEFSDNPHCIINGNTFTLAGDVNLKTIITLYEDIYHQNCTCLAIPQFLKIIHNCFYNTFISKKLYFVLVLPKLGKICLFSCSKMNLVKTVNLKFFKKFILNGKNELSLKFYPGSDVNSLYIKFLSSKERDEFINDLLPPGVGYLYAKQYLTSIKLFQKAIMLEISMSCRPFLQFIIAKTRAKLGKTGVLYIPKIYDAIATISSPWRKPTLKKLMFTFSNSSLCEQGYRLLFLSFAVVKHNKEEERMMKKLSEEMSIDECNKGGIDDNISISISIDIDRYSENEMDMDYIQYINRPRHKNVSKLTVNIF